MRPRQAKRPAPPLATQDLQWWRRRFRLRPLIFSHLLTVAAQKCLVRQRILPYRLPKKVRKNRSRAVLAGQTACPTIGSTRLALVAQAVSPASRDFFTASNGRGSEVAAERFRTPVLQVGTRLTAPARRVPSLPADCRPDNRAPPNKSRPA